MVGQAFLFAPQTTGLHCPKVLDTFINKKRSHWNISASHSVVFL
jgi:hypothetical protein